MGAAIIAAASAAASLASSLWGAHKSAEANGKTQAQIRAEKAANDAWYRRKYNEDYSNTAAGQNMIRMARDYARENWQKAQGAAAVAGGTDEASARAKESGNRMIGNAIANMDAADTQRKDNIERQYRSTDSELNMQQKQAEQQKADNIAQAASNASNALASGANAIYGAVGSGANNINSVGDSGKLLGNPTMANGMLNLDKMIKSSQYYRKGTYTQV